MIAKLKAEISSHIFIYLLLFLVVLGAIFVRVYRVDQILWFYFDQGRDALVIWDFWHKGDLFFVGPTTGIAGIFRGPWYYWLIAPIYLVGGGDPIWPATFLSLLSVVAVIFIFILGKEIAGRSAGLIAAIIASFSYYIMIASRWLSNPTPMLIISVLIIFSSFRIIDSKKPTKYWLLILFLLGMAMQFGSAAEIFYFPVVALIVIWKRKTLSKRLLFVSFCLLVISFLPQIIFDIRHQGILSGNIQKFLFEEGSFKLSFWEIIKIRLPFYWDMFTNKIWPGEPNLIKSATVMGFLVFVANWREILKNNKFKITLLFWISPMIGMLFFQGNYGNVYDYYFTGFYLIFILLFSTIFSFLLRSSFGLILLVTFFFFFFKINLPLIKNFITAGVDGPTTVAFGNQKQAVDWIYEDLPAGRQVPFSIDVYVPPVIPYAYDYLFVWYGPKIAGYEPSKDVINPLYTIYEVDPPHPERLEAWLKRQEGIGIVEKEKKFGGIVVQKRERI